MRNIHVTPEPVVLEGYQAVMKPSQYGYSLRAVVGQDLIDKLEEERTDCLKWAESKLKNPKRSSLKPEPWEEVSDGKYIIKFSWSEDKRPPVVDTGDLDQAGVAELFGKTSGYKANEPNVEAAGTPASVEDDF